MAQKIHKVKHGKVERHSFSQVKERYEIPYFIALQKDSYDQFLNEGIREVLRKVTPIEEELGGKSKLHFLDVRLEDPKYTIKQCKDMDLTYAAPLKVKTRLERGNGEVVESEVFMGEIPLMTETGSFIINGAERVIVSQIIRSSGIFGNSEVDVNGVTRYGTLINPLRGAWLEFKEDKAGVLWASIDKKKKLTATMFLRALSDSYAKDQDLMNLFADDETIAKTIAKDRDKPKMIENIEEEETINVLDSPFAREYAIKEIYRKIKPGEVSPSIENQEKHIMGMFFDNKRYNLARVGRYKCNKKLSLGTRAIGLKLAADAVTEDGEVIAVKGTVLDEAQARRIQNEGINILQIELPDGSNFQLIGNATVDFKDKTGLDPSEFGLMQYVDYIELKSILENSKDENDLKILLRAKRDDLVRLTLTQIDIIAVVNYNLGLIRGIGKVDNIDHLGNRRVRAVGELIQDEFRQGVGRLERSIKDKMKTTQDEEDITPKKIINVKPLTSIVKQFFCSNQLSQFMEQPNPIAELTHKRKLSALGRGGLTRERANFEVRDINYTHYGRLCPIETPEGQNIGLITSLSMYAKINEYGFLETPYVRVDKKKRRLTDEIVYLDADDEERYIIAHANVKVDDKGKFLEDYVTCRFREEIKEFPVEDVDFVDVSPKQLISVATSLIPFLENDDTARALMGSNMQRQAVPLLNTEAPIVATGIEHKIAIDSGILILAEEDGVVSYVDAETIKVKNTEGLEKEYKLKKFDRSNQDTCINQRPIVETGDEVKKGDVLADGPSTSDGELALGRNMLIAFMPWEGYNFEDAVLISEDLVKDDIFTSVHIKKYEIEARDSTKIGNEEITRDIPNLPAHAIKNLDEDGIIRVGAEVKSGDILVGKITPKGRVEDSVTEKFIKELFGDKSVEEVRNSSLKLPHGEKGVVVDVKVYSRENKDELSPGVSKKVRVYVAQKRKVSVGDKMAGRHGNKGVVAKVMPKEDMPFLADGTPVQIVLNPLGVPSRMNIGQVLEVHLGLAAKQLDWKVETPVFDGATEKDIQALLEKSGLPANGKVDLYDGRTGEKFENPVTVGYMYYLKLNHLVDDKIHARAIGPYSAITQQPLGGKAQFGGQRFGEMEVWALEAYGASNILQEMLTVKSDDIKGRAKVYKSILEGKNFSEPGIPEAFKVLIKELRSLALNTTLLTEEKEKINVGDFSSDDTDFIPLQTMHQEEEKQTVSVLAEEKVEDILSGEALDVDDLDPSVFLQEEFNLDELFGDDSSKDE